MPNYYEISPAHDTLSLHDGQGSASFAVRYVGDHRVEARAVAVPMEGAKESWLQVEPPNQCDMQPGQTQTFKVTVTVPPGTAEGRYGLRLDVVSVHNPDEEYDRGPLITFEVEETKEPEPKPGFPWWAVIAAALVLIVIIGGIVWWFNRDSGPDARPVPVPVPDPGEVVVEPVGGPGVDRSGTFRLRKNVSGDFESGRQVPDNARGADVFYRVRTVGGMTGSVLNTRGRAEMAILGRRDEPNLREIKAVLDRPTVQEVSANNMSPGFWIAVRTVEGNFAAFTLVNRVSPGATSVSLRYRLWEN